MKVVLFCLPFAGGSKYSLYFLKKVLPDDISCHFLEYPGRGARIKDGFAEDIDAVVNDIFLEIAPLLEKPYAIYGHSMGATITYLLALKIRDEGRPAPLHLFISGTDAPSVENKNPLRYLLPKNEFITAVKELGGVPDELLQHEELLEYFEPILRADFKAVETYTYKATTPLHIPLTVMTGEEEDMQEEDILSWQKETTLPIRFNKFPGNHFFIFEHQSEIGKIIASNLQFKR